MTLTGPPVISAYTEWQHPTRDLVLALMRLPAPARQSRPGRGTAHVRSVFTARSSACGSGASDEVEFVTTGNTELRYGDGRFVQSWRTPRQPGSCFTVTVTTADGSTLSALFRLR